MKKIVSRIFGISVYTKIPQRSALFLSLALFIIIIGGYLAISYARHVDNPADKIVPTLSQLVDGIERAVSVDKDGQRPIIVDTLASMKRFGLGLLLGSSIGILLGLLMGLFPLFESLFLRFVLYFGKVPPLALLPIIFVMVGIGEELKVILIGLGILFPLAMDTYFNTSPKSKKGIPEEQLVKALSLGIGTPSLVWNIVLPQLMPSILNAIRLNLLNAWLFLIASEAIAAEAGLGYRIFLVRRYMAMDTIIPYVFWIAMLSFLFDAILALAIRRFYPWYEEAKK